MARDELLRSFDVAIARLRTAFPERKLAQFDEAARASRAEIEASDTDDRDWHRSAFYFWHPPFDDDLSDEDFDAIEAVSAHPDLKYWL